MTCWRMEAKLMILITTVAVVWGSAASVSDQSGVVESGPYIWIRLLKDKVFSTSSKESRSLLDGENLGTQPYMDSNVHRGVSVGSPLSSESEQGSLIPSESATLFNSGAGTQGITVTGPAVTADTSRSIMPAAVPSTDEEHRFASSLSHSFRSRERDPSPPFGQTAEDTVSNVRHTNMAVSRLSSENPQGSMIPSGSAPQSFSSGDETRDAIAAASSAETADAIRQIKPDAPDIDEEHPSAQFSDSVRHPAINDDSNPSAKVMEPMTRERDVFSSSEQTSVDTDSNVDREDRIVSPLSWENRQGPMTATSRFNSGEEDRDAIAATGSAATADASRQINPRFVTVTRTYRLIPLFSHTHTFGRVTKNRDSSPPFHHVPRHMTQEPDAFA